MNIKIESMKSLGIILILCFGMLSCKTQQDVTPANEDNLVKVKVVRDCSGTYINIEGKDYKVCNEDVLKDFEVGDEVEITYEDVETCEMEEGVAVCMLYHENEGSVQVLSVI